MLEFAFPLLLIGAIIWIIVLYRSIPTSLAAITIKEYEYKGKIYTILYEAILKDPHTRNWVHCVVYRRGDSIYVRERGDFYQKFKRVSERVKYYKPGSNKIVEEYFKGPK